MEDIKDINEKIDKVREGVLALCKEVLCLAGKMVQSRGDERRKEDVLVLSKEVFQLEDKLEKLNAKLETVVNNCASFGELLIELERKVDERDKTYSHLLMKLEERLESSHPDFVSQAGRQWEPQGGNWAIQNDGDVVWVRTIDKKILSKKRRFGMRYPTLILAKKARDLMRITHTLIAYQIEHCPYYVPKEGKDNWYCYYDHHQKLFLADSETVVVLGTVYFDEDTAHRFVDDLNSGKIRLRELEALTKD